jgi:FkbM family methyltransferase
MFGEHKGFFLETGSSDPIDQNNTYSLEMNGWKGILVEPRTNHNHDYKILRPNSIVENYALVDRNFKYDTIESYSHGAGHMFAIGGIHGTGYSKVEWKAITLDKLLKKHKIKNVDFFSLDVEGYEHEVLDGIDFEYTKFNVIIIETHDYTWNSKSNDFSYLEKYGYSLKEYLTPNHQVWTSNYTQTT